MLGSGLSDLGAVLLRDAPTPPISSDPLTLRSSGEDSTDLRSLLGRGERWHLMSFGANANARPQEVKVTAYGAVAYLPSLSDSATGRGPGLRARHRAGRRLRPRARRPGGAGIARLQGGARWSRARGGRGVPLGGQAAGAGGHRSRLPEGSGGYRGLAGPAPRAAAAQALAVRSLRQRGPGPRAAPDHQDPDLGERADRPARLADLRAHLRHRGLRAHLAHRGGPHPHDRAPDLRQRGRVGVLRGAAGSTSRGPRPTA